MMAGLEIGRVQVAARALGIARAAFDDALAYTQARAGLRPADLAHRVSRQPTRGHGNEPHGRPLSHRTPPARWMPGNGPSGGGDGQAVRLRGLPWRSPRRDADSCGYGYSTEFDIERYFRDAPLMIVGEGTNEVLRNVIVKQAIESPAAGTDRSR